MLEKVRQMLHRVWFALYPCTMHESIIPFDHPVVCHVYLNTNLSIFLLIDGRENAMQESHDVAFRYHFGSNIQSCVVVPSLCVPA
jgi:hypothetical protein